MDLELKKLFACLSSGLDGERRKRGTDELVVKKKKREKGKGKEKSNIDAREESEVERRSRTDLK